MFQHTRQGTPFIGEADMGEMGGHPSLPATEDDVIDLSRFYRHDDADLFAKVDAFMEQFEHVRARDLYLWRHELCSANSRESLVRAPSGEQRQMLIFSSNNYLGLTTHPRVTAAACVAIHRFGAGAGSAPFFCGTYELHRALEKKLAAHKQAEDAALFTSGYATNVGVISALARPTDTVFSDQLVHASIIDGIRMSGAKTSVFRHNDLADLEKKLLGAKGEPGGKLIVVDGIYSMDGDIAPLPGILALARRHGAVVLVDEAHSTGVLGAHGRGMAEHFGLDGSEFLVVGTLSKALGSVGGFFAGPRKVVEYVRHYARSSLFSTAVPPSAVAAALTALEVIEAEPERVVRLRASSRLVRDRLMAAGLSVPETRSPIIPVVIGDPAKLLSIGRELLDEGLHVNTVFHPAVPKDQCRLRISVTSEHTREDLERLISAVIGLTRRYGIGPDAFAMTVPPEAPSSRAA